MPLHGKVELVWVAFADMLGGCAGCHMNLDSVRGNGGNWVTYHLGTFKVINVEGFSRLLKASKRVRPVQKFFSNSHSHVFI